MLSLSKHLARVTNPIEAPKQLRRFDKLRMTFFPDVLTR